MKNKRFLEELATSYQISEALFCAIELDIFSLIEEEELSTEELAVQLGFNENKLARFLHALKTLDLITEYEGKWSNMPVSREYLIKDTPNYLGKKIINETKTLKDWSSLKDEIASSDSSESFRVNFYDALTKEEINAILSIFPSSYRKESSENSLKIYGEVPDSLTSALKNQLSAAEHGKLNIVLLFNLDQESTDDIADLFSKLYRELNNTGILLIINRFLDYDKKRSALTDLFYMLESTDKQLFYSRDILNYLKEAGFIASGLIPVSESLALIAAAKTEDKLLELNLSKEDQLKTELLNLGFDDIVLINPKEVVTDPFTKNLCDFGCRSGSDPAHQKNCMHHKNLTYQKTREVLDSYSKAFLLCGTPPTGAFQHQALEAQAEAFKSGYYKAFVYWAGPCSLCEDCDGQGTCKNPQARRPSMEGAGIDVFSTVERAGKPIKPLREKGEFIHYFALLLLE